MLKPGPGLAVGGVWLLTELPVGAGPQSVVWASSPEQKRGQIGRAGSGNGAGARQGEQTRCPQLVWFSAKGGWWGGGLQGGLLREGWVSEEEG